MKITKRQLRRIIKEESAKIISERMDPNNPGAYEEWKDSMAPTSHQQLLQIQDIIKTAFMNKSMGVKPEIADDYLEKIKGIIS